MEFIKKVTEVYFDAEECDALGKTCTILDELIEGLEENDCSIVYNRTTDKEYEISELTDALALIYGLDNEDIIVY